MSSILHDNLQFNISLIYACSDGETFISADDLRINLWNFGNNSQSFNIIDIKPANMEDLTGRNPGLMFQRFDSYMSYV